MLSQSEEIRGDVLLASGKALTGGGKLLHQREAEIGLFGAEVDGDETAPEMAGGIPTDLAAQSGGIARTFNITQFGEEFEQDRPEEMPIFGAAGEERPQPKLGTLHFVNVDDGQVTLTTGGDIEAEPPFGLGLKDFEE